jgi:hypothetical protein
MAMELCSFLSSALDGVTGQPYAPDGFIQGVVAPVAFVKEAVGTPETVWTLLEKRKISFTCLGPNPGPS